MEEYKLIVDFPNYEISNHGNVRNLITGRILITTVNNAGYLRLHLSNKGLRKTFFIHRLVAIAFIDNPLNKKQVDHIDNNKTNNSLTNLRWATQNENQYNRPIDIKNRSGVRGVHWSKRAKKWEAQIRIDGIKVYLGTFTNIEDAKQARMKKANEIFGEFVNDCEKILPTIKLNSTVKLFKQIDKLLNEINHIKHL